MTRILRIGFLASSVASMVFAQTWEVGASGGYGMFRDVKVTNGSQTGLAGFASGIAFGGVFGNQITERFGGEVRYTYRADDLRVKSGGTTATLGGHSQAIHYDLMIHATPRESPVRPFLAAGAGVKLYRGTGAEAAFQPLSNLVVLSHTNESQPLISAGGGVKFRMSRRSLFRIDFRDYATPTPTSLLASPRGKLGGWIHDFVLLVGISSVF